MKTRTAGRSVTAVAPVPFEEKSFGAISNQEFSTSLLNPVDNNVCSSQAIEELSWAGESEGLKWLGVWGSNYKCM